MKGYKVFNPDWTCRELQYQVGGFYEMDDKPVVCNRGFHFCIKASDCFKFYDFNSQNKVAEIEAYGDIDQEADSSKCCTNKIKIVREIPWDEVLRIVNEGRDCTGLANTGNWNTGNWNTGNWNTGNRNTGSRNAGDCNTGDKNTGNWNTGNRNTGNRNTGNWNTGNWNTGNRNTGNWNTGNWNTGNRNTGNWNTGNRNTGSRNAGDMNTGDWNKVSYSSGCFNTDEQKMIMFNKPCDWTLRDWFDCKAKRLLDQIPKKVVKWVQLSDMSDEEKIVHSTCKTTGGYLKILDESKCVQLWWNVLPEEDKQVILSLPNFDADIFEECTGIRV